MCFPSIFFICEWGLVVGLFTGYYYFTIKFFFDGFAFMFLFNYLMYMSDAKKQYEMH